MQRSTLQSASLVFFALFLAGTSVARAAIPAPTCFESLDKLLQTRASRIVAEKKFRDDLENLAQSCPKIPHIQHNLAVLYANEQDWPTAIDYLEKSLTLDERARQSVDALAKIYRFQAVLAYRDALQSNSPAPEPPSFDLQDSRVKNYQIESYSDVSENPESLREKLDPLIGNWWRKTILENSDCMNCYTETYAGTHIESNKAKGRDQSTSPDDRKTLPNYLIVTAASNVIAILRDPGDQEVYSLKILQTAEGWRIDDEQRL